MIIVKKKNIKLIIWKKIFKINKNYIKNFKIVCEIKKISNKKNLVILNALNSSHHSKGIYKKNLKNIGWWNKIIEKFQNFKIINISDIDSSYGTSNNNSKLILKYKKYKINFLKINNKNLIKIKKNILKKIKLKKIYITIGASIGGIKNIIFYIIYPKIIKFSLNIATCLKLFLKNKIKNINNNQIMNNITSYKKIFYNFLNLKNLKIIRKINNLEYLSKVDINNKKKNIIKKNYVKKKYKKNIFKYLDYKSNKFVKYYNIKCYISLLKNTKKNIFIKNINFKKNKNLIITFKNDIKFNLKKSFKILKNFLKIKKETSLKIIKINNGHDSFLINNIKYKNTIRNIISEW